MGNWIPDREQDYVDLCNMWVLEAEVPNIHTVYNWDEAELMMLLQSIKSFLDARKMYEAINSTTHLTAKNVAKKKAKAAMREFANSSIRFNKNMDEGLKKKFGIMPKDNTPTVQQRPTIQPTTVVATTIYHYQHKLKAVNVENGKAVKPAGIYGVRFAWKVGGEKPLSGDDLPRGKFSRKAEYTVIHTEIDKGKPAYYASCYENARGDAGPWSPVVEAYIA